MSNFHFPYDKNCHQFMPRSPDWYSNRFGEGAYLTGKRQNIPNSSTL